MYKIAVLTSIVLMIVSAADYVRRAWIKETKPVPATWILMMVMMSLSGWMYAMSPRKSWTGNIGVMTGIVNVAIILSGVVATNLRDRTLKVAFDKTQRFCLGCGVGVALCWFCTKEPLLAYALVQVIALIAYAATVQKLWRAERSSEPLFLWTSVLLANLCALYPAWVRHDLYSWIYLARAVPSTAGVIYLILRLKRKSREVRISYTG